MAIFNSYVKLPEGISTQRKSTNFQEFFRHPEKLMLQFLTHSTLDPAPSDSLKTNGWLTKHGWLIKIQHSQLFIKHPHPMTSGNSNFIFRPAKPQIDLSAF
jgi:hypothetical protein